MPAKAHPGSQFSVVDFPKECVHGGVVLSAFFHMEKSLEHVCEELDHVQLCSLQGTRRKLSRPMELKDFLMFVQERAKDAFITMDKDFSKGFLDYMIKYRNHLFHDRHLPLVEATVAFYQQSNKLLDLVHGDTANQRTKEIAHMLSQTSVWLKEKHAPPPCCVEKTSGGRVLVNWIIGPTDILEGRNARVEQIVGSLTKPGKPIWLYGPSGIGKKPSCLKCGVSASKNTPFPAFFPVHKPANTGGKLSADRCIFLCLYIFYKDGQIANRS